jgi:hypothetical protein
LFVTSLLPTSFLSGSLDLLNFVAFFPRSGDAGVQHASKAGC